MKERTPYPAGVSNEKWSLAAPCVILMGDDAPQRRPASFRERGPISEHNAIGFLKETAAGTPANELCGKHGFSDASFYAWRAKFGGMEVSNACRLKDLETENSRLKRLLAEACLPVRAEQAVETTT